MGLFKKNAVREGVLKIINDRIEDAQADYEEGVDKISNDTAEAVSTIIEASHTKKHELLDSCIASVIH